MSNAIDWTHLSENYRGKWVALGEDLTTVLAACASAPVTDPETPRSALVHALLPTRAALA